MTTDPTTKRPGVLPKRNNLGVQSGTINRVAEKIAGAESATLQEYDLRQVTLSDIELWNDQPRKFHLNIDDIYRGNVLENDSNYKVKSEQMEGLIGLSMSIKEFGILNPPLALDMPGKKVQLLGGQRRVMAFIFSLFHIRTVENENEEIYNEVAINPDPDISLLDIERIEVKVILRRPDELTKERMAMIDNVQRVDLPIGDKLRWVISFADRRESYGNKIIWRDLLDTLGVSRSQAYEWLSIVDSRKDVYVMEVIKKVISNLVSFSKLMEIVKADPESRKLLHDKWFGDRPVSDDIPRVSLGKTDNLKALRSLVLTNSEGEIKEHFESINWDNPKNAKKGFEEFLIYWERKHG
jgi:hypothetical protein